MYKMRLQISCMFAYTGENATWGGLSASEFSATWDEPLHDLHFIFRVYMHSLFRLLSHFSFQISIVLRPAGLLQWWGARTRFILFSSFIFVVSSYSFLHIRFSCSFLQICFLTLFLHICHCFPFVSSYFVFIFVYANVCLQIRFFSLICSDSYVQIRLFNVFVCFSVVCLSGWLHGCLFICLFVC